VFSFLPISSAASTTRATRPDLLIAGERRAGRNGLRAPFTATDVSTNELHPRDRAASIIRRRRSRTTADPMGPTLTALHYVTVRVGNFR